MLCVAKCLTWCLFVACCWLLETRHEKSLKMSANQIFLIWNVHTFFRHKLPIYKNVGEEKDQNVYICSKLLLILKFLPSIWSICSRNVWLVVDFLLFWQKVHIFSPKCPWTRFARFAVYFMSDPRLWQLKLVLFYFFWPNPRVSALYTIEL